jgi:hypothetical protein
VLGEPIVLEGKSVLLALALALASASPALAHFAERQRSLSAYVEGSDLVVRGVIDDVDQALVGEHAKQDGRATVRVEEALKGGPAGEGPLRFTTTGVHQPRYRKGEHVLLFLNRKPGTDPVELVTLQSAIEGVDLDGADGSALLSAVRGYVAVDRTADPVARLARLKAAILRDLESPTSLLWQNALFDLSKRSELSLDRTDVARLERLALAEARPSVLRVGCVAKLGAVSAAGEPTAAEALARIVRSKGDPFVRSVAVTAIGESHAPPAHAVLLHALRDSDQPVRRAAADGLGRLGRSDAIDPLARVAAGDPARLVRFSALKAIARIGGGPAEKALSRLADRSPSASREIDLARREVTRQTGGQN